MYQHEMFDSVIRTTPYLGCGVHARVHDLGDGRAFKRSTKRDGTLNWLEWCKAMQDAGEYMPGMPVVHSIVHTDEGYVCVMDKYEHSYMADDSYEDLEDDPLSYIVAVKEAYESFMCDSGLHPDEAFCDMHCENYMYDPVRKTIVITDPSADDYLKPEFPEFLTLQ